MFGELAAQQGARFVIVSCDADRQMMAERIEARQQARIDPSEADVAVLDRQLQNMQPLRSEELAHTVTANTSQASACEKTLAAIQEQLAPRHSCGERNHDADFAPNEAITVKIRNPQVHSLFAAGGSVFGNRRRDACGTLDV